MFKTIFFRFSFWLAVAGIVAAVLFMQKTNRAEPLPVVPIPPPAKPERNSIAASGIAEALGENVKIGLPAPSLITDIKVAVWDRVKKGEPLLVLDDRELRAQLPVLESEVQVAIANRDLLQEKLDRLKSVRDVRAVSKEEITTQEANLRIAEAQIGAARAAVTQTRALIDRLTVTAPRDGTILQVNARAGEYGQTSASNPVIVLGNLDYFQIRADVDEALAPRVSPGAKATGYLKGDTTRPLDLEFVRIEPYVIPKVSLTGASTERVDTRVLQVIYRIKANPAIPIYPGQQMDVFIQEIEPKSAP